MAKLLRQTNTVWKEVSEPSLPLSLPWGQRHHISKCQVDSRSQEFLATGQAVVPVTVGGEVHHQQAPMLQLQLDSLNVARGVFASGILVPEDKVPAGSKGHGCDGAARGQLSLIISVLPHVIVTVLIPGREGR